jgi:hypothetical protein
MLCRIKEQAKLEVAAAPARPHSFGSGTSGDATALERRGQLLRFSGALSRASRDVPPDGSDDREPFQRGLAGVAEEWTKLAQEAEAKQR